MSNTPASGTPDNKKVIRTVILATLLFGLVVGLAACRIRYPLETSQIFHIPYDLDTYTATKFMAFETFIVFVFVVEIARSILRTLRLIED